MIREAVRMRPHSALGFSEIRSGHLRPWRGGLREEVKELPPPGLLGVGAQGREKDVLQVERGLLSTSSKICEVKKAAASLPSAPSAVRKRGGEG